MTVEANKTNKGIFPEKMLQLHNNYTCNLYLSDPLYGPDINEFTPLYF